VTVAAKYLWIFGNISGWSNAVLERIAKPKPRKGDYALSRSQRRKAHKAREQKIMRWAKQVRDGNKCRVPRCGYKDLPIDCCHLRHRGAGGNPREDRTTSAGLVALCRRHHGALDRGDLEIEPLTPAGMDNIVAWYERDQETGKLNCIGIESRIGVSVERAQ
jgi:hypothetical protein